MGVLMLKSPNLTTQHSDFLSFTLLKGMMIQGEWIFAEMQLRWKPVVLMVGSFYI